MDFHRTVARLVIATASDQKITTVTSLPDSAIVIPRHTAASAISARSVTGISLTANLATATDTLAPATRKLENVTRAKTSQPDTTAIVALKAITETRCSEVRLDADLAVALTQSLQATPTRVNALSFPAPTMSSAIVTRDTLEQSAMFAMITSSEVPTNPAVAANNVTATTISMSVVQEIAMPKTENVFNVCMRPMVLIANTARMDSGAML